MEGVAVINPHVLRQMLTLNVFTRDEKTLFASSSGMSAKMSLLFVNMHGAYLKLLAERNFSSA